MWGRRVEEGRGEEPSSSPSSSPSAPPPAPCLWWDQWGSLPAQQPGQRLPLGELSIPHRDATSQKTERASLQRHGTQDPTGAGGRHGEVYHLIVDVVLVGVILVKNEFQKLPLGVHIDRLQLPRSAARLLVVAEGDIAARHRAGLAGRVRPRRKPRERAGAGVGGPGTRIRVWGPGPRGGVLRRASGFQEGVPKVALTLPPSCSPKSAEALRLERGQVLGQAVADVELHLAGDHVLVGQQLQLPDAASLHHLHHDLLWELAAPESRWAWVLQDARCRSSQVPGDGTRGTGTPLLPSRLLRRGLDLTCLPPGTAAGTWLQVKLKFITRSTRASKRLCGQASRSLRTPRGGHTSGALA